MIEEITQAASARGARPRRASVRDADRQRAPLGAPELHAGRPQGARAAGMVDSDDDARRMAIVFDFWDRAARRVPLRRRHAAGVGRRRRRRRRTARTSTSSSRSAAPVDDGRARARDAGSTRCSRRTCSCSGSTPVRATRTPARTCSTTAACCCCARSTGSARRTSRGAPTVASDMPHRDVLAAFVLDGVDLHVTDFGTSVTQPEDYLAHVVEFALFDVSSGAPVADRRRRARRARGRGEGRADAALPHDRGHGTPGQDRRGRVRVLHVPAAVRGAGRRRARLDRAARQPRPLPVARAHRRRACPAASRTRRPRRTTPSSRDVVTAMTSRRDERAHAPGAASGWCGDVAPRRRDRRRHRACRCGSSCAPALGVAWWWTYLVRCPTSTASVVVRDHEVACRARDSRSAPTGCGPSSCARRRSSTGRSGSRRSACASTTRPTSLHGEIGERMRGRARHRVGGRCRRRRSARARGRWPRRLRAVRARARRSAARPVAVRARRGRSAIARRGVRRSTDRWSAWMRAPGLAERLRPDRARRETERRADGLPTAVRYVATTGSTRGRGARAVRGPARRRARRSRSTLARALCRYAVRTRRTGPIGRRRMVELARSGADPARTVWILRVAPGSMPRWTTAPTCSSSRAAASLSGSRCCSFPASCCGSCSAATRRPRRRASWPACSAHARSCSASARSPR